MAWVDFWNLLISALFVLVPAGFLVFARPIVRWVFIAIGLVSIPAFFWFAETFGIHATEMLVPVAGFFLGAGALLVEAIAFPTRLIRGRHEAASVQGVD